MVDSGSGTQITNQKHKIKYEGLIYFFIRVYIIQLRFMQSGENKISFY